MSRPRADVGGADGHSHIKVLLAGISSPILTLDVARFAYTPFLTVMQDQHPEPDSQHDPHTVPRP